MSPSRRSESASPSSRKTGAETDTVDPTGDDDGDDAAAAPVDALAIELETSRQRPAGWTVFGIVAGSLLVWKLGTVGVWSGILLIVIGVFRAWELVQSYRYPAGTIRVSSREVVLPRGLHVPDPVRIAPADVTAVYFLRRAVPMNRAAPVLVVEVGKRAIAYPRDWFASEADQRNVVHALLSLRPAEPDAGGARATLDIDPHPPWLELVGGGALLVASIVGALVARNSGADYRLAVGPMIAGAMLVWRALNKWL